MDKNRARFKQMEMIMTIVLCVDAAIFLAYLISAGFGITGLKIVTTILCFLISGAVLYFLYTTRGLLRKRSIWMTLSAACIILCVLASLILRFPAPALIIP